MDQSPCPFCTPTEAQVFYRGQLVLALWDVHPVSPGHALLLPQRHVPDWWSATPVEQQELTAALTLVRQELLRHYQPAGFNLGMNLGAAAGQTIEHLHLHLIPRYQGDVRDPRGGIRHVIPHRGNYLLGSPALHLLAGEPHAQALVRGGPDPFLPHLRASLDRARAADLAVAFVLESGVRLLIEHLRDLLQRGGRLRLVTGDYLGVTEPEALAHLLDLEGDVQLYVWEAGEHSFHPKAYLLHQGDNSGTAYVGSSNLSAMALGAGLEWNYRVLSAHNDPGFADLQAAFEALLIQPACRPLTREWLTAYRGRRVTAGAQLLTGLDPVPERPVAPEPHSVQQEALRALEQTRAEGNTAGLVVMATGLGKTWLAAFDSARPEFRRALFVAHREEILGQALDTFRGIRPTAYLGKYTGTEKVPAAEVLFASVQTLSRLAHLRQFERTAFDYVVIDEFHHAAAATYRRLIDYFQPRFLLGLTATPERTDGGDLLALCQENLVYRCDLAEGLQRGLLSPFRYFGVPDEVDYRNIPWRSRRFEEAALTEAVATQQRAQNVLEQYRRHGGHRTLAFCCSTRHADFMADFFWQQGIRAVAVHSGSSSAPRAASLEQLEAGQLQVIFAIDMFNEGVDLPQVDTVLMLRPTESRILWLQQLGRGLRKALGKTALTVVDYIGNHRTFLLKIRALLESFLGPLPTDADMARALTQLSANQITLPAGCAVTYDLVAVDILQALLRRGDRPEQMEAYYRSFREQQGERPRAVEAYHDGYDPGLVRTHHGSWLRFVEAMGDFSPGQRQVLSEAGDFLSTLETTPLTRSFKMLTLQALLNLDALPGAASIQELTTEFARLAQRSARYRADVNCNLEEVQELQRYLERNPLAAWVGGQGTGGHAFFRYDKGQFETTFTVSAGLRADFRDLVAELVEWRLAAYLGRQGGTSHQHMEASTTALRRWGHYLRQDIPPLFGLEFNQAIWNVGYLRREGRLFLLVTLEKEDLPEGFRYTDRFLGPDLFEWQSQNRTRQDSVDGQALRDHEKTQTEVHLFVRRSKKIKGKAAPFIYCGTVAFVGWENDAPITIRWRLPEPVPEVLRPALLVPEPPAPGA